MATLQRKRAKRFASRRSAAHDLLGDGVRHLDKIRSFAEAGFDHVYVHQVGPNQEAFFRFYERSILPEARKM